MIFLERRTRIKVVVFALIAVFLASVALASFASAASSNAAGTETYQTFILDKRIHSKRALSAGFDLDHTTTEQLNDARNVRSSNMPPHLLNAQSTRSCLNSYNFAASLDYNFLQPQGIRSALDKGFLPCHDKTTTLKLLVYGLNCFPGNLPPSLLHA